jgi:hypothetical protein
MHAVSRRIYRRTGRNNGAGWALPAGNAGHALDLWPKWNIEIQYPSLLLLCQRAPANI